MPNRASKTLLEHAGGQPTLQRLVDAFYTSVLADPLLQPLFGTGRPGHVDHLTAFTAETFGGPLAFTDRLGFAHLIDIHPPEIAMLIPALRLQVSAPPQLTTRGDSR